ncbi:DUF6313 family protein [Pseudonocardia acaciae]|uniref:DUF6313 family protein n=1 Tax=Pseudonocardia acaciae TaxID=551276 RepID=UPI003CCB8588
MGKWIPLLSDFCYQNEFGIEGSFTIAFVRQHHNDWGTAQDHWERIVSRVLDTEAIPTGASGTEAMFHAVRASTVIIDRDHKGRCPHCAKSSSKRRSATLQSKTEGGQ